MPKGPRGEKRPADVIGNAVKVMRIAIGEETEELDSVKSAAAELGSRGGKARAIGEQVRNVARRMTGPKSSPRASSTRTVDRLTKRPVRLLSGDGFALGFSFAAIGCRPFRNEPGGSKPKAASGSTASPVLSRSVLEFDGAVSGRIRIRGQAARSNGLSASFWLRVCHPSTLRIVI